MVLSLRAIVGGILGASCFCSVATAAPVVVSDITLDLNSDGIMDRVALVENKGAADLYIYLGAGAAPLDVSKRPSFIKKELPYNNKNALTVSGKNAFTLQNGCGGCSNDNETTLTIVDRHGTFLVAGYTLDWDTRTSQGTCDINYLTGKGTLSHTMGKAKPIKAKFKAIKLADWTDESAPPICQE